MTARFAGSMELAQRRRRRLAEEASGARSSTTGSRSSRSSGDSNSSAVDQFRVAVPRLPRETMIPGNWSVLFGICLAGFFAWCFVTWLGVSSIPVQLGIGELVSLDKGPVPRYFSTLALLLTSQLTLLIYWHRSRSRKDFLGRYRIWGWAGAFWCMICLAHATHFHLPLLQFISQRFVINCWRGEVLTWFVPLAVGVLTNYRLVSREVNPSAPSSIAWNTAFCLALVVASLHFGLELLFPPTWRGGILSAVTMLWHYSLAVTCLLHARYVTHVTNEVGPKRLTARARVSHKLTPQISRLGERILSVRVPLPRRRGKTDTPLGNQDDKLPRKLRKNSMTANESAKSDSRSSTKKSKNSSTKDSSAVVQAPLNTAGRIPWKQKVRALLAVRWSRKAAATEAASETGSSEAVEGSLQTESKTRKNGSAQSGRKPGVKQDASTAEIAQEKGPSWGARLKAAVAARWKKKEQLQGDSPEDEAPAPARRKPTAATAEQVESTQPATKRDEKQDAPTTEPPGEKAPSWGARLKAAVADRWKKKEQPQGTSLKKEAEKPASSKTSIVKAEKKQAAESRPTTQQKSTEPGSSQEESPRRGALGKRLSESLLGGWKKRVDSAHAEGEAVAAPHTAPGLTTATGNTMPPKASPASQPKPEPRIEADEDSDASFKSKKSAAAHAPKQKLPSALQRDYDDDDEDEYEDVGGGSGGMSAKERKRLKKMQRQQGR